MKTGLRRQRPQKRRIQRPAGEQDLTVGASPKFGRRTTIKKIINCEGISSPSYIKDISTGGSFAVWKDNTKEYTFSIDKILASSIEIEITRTYGGTSTTALWAKAKGTSTTNVAVNALADTAAQNNVAIFADAENGTSTNYAIQTVHGEIVVGFGSIYMYGKASANADKSGYGQIWVKAGAPTELWFTDDAGLDTKIV